MIITKKLYRDRNNSSSKIAICLILRHITCSVWLQDAVNFFVEPACGKARHSPYYLANVCVRASVYPSGFVQAITRTVMDGFQNFKII